MKAQIVAWLNGSRDFKPGVELLKAAGVQGIPETETSNAKTKVFNALRAMLRAGQPEAPTTPAATPKRDTYTASLSPTNEAAKEAKRRADLLFKEMQHVRAQLFALCPRETNSFENEGAKVAERGALALRVVAMQDDVNEAYEDARFAEVHWRLPEKETAPAEHPATDLPRLISNLSKNIYRIRKKPGHDTAELAAKEAELENLKKQLKNALG